MSDSLNNKELVAAGHKFARLVTSDMPLIDVTNMITRLAERLDCTTAALHATQAQRDQLAAENGVLKITGKDVVDHWRAAGLGKMEVEMMKCMPELHKSLETPATDAFLAEVRAQGVEMFSNAIGVSYQKLKPGSAQAKALKNVVFLAVHFAAQLRQEAAQ